MTAENAGVDPLLGRLIGGKFRVERALGRGAMGKVYLAEQTNLGKQVALKVLHANLAGDPSLEKRFHREARAASMLSHPNIVQTVDFGNDAGVLYIAMELLDGRDLRQTIRDEWPFAPERVAHIVGQILSALDEAHAKGLVHRDLKPENVMLLDARGEPDFVKVCDFGIAKVQSERDGEGSAITSAGLVCGTPEYMSPEQARGDALDGRSDLYSVAVILYHMVAGELPFRAESALGVVTKHLMEAPVPPSKKRPGAVVPPGLEALVLRGLEKERDSRFASALEMKGALYASVGLPPPRSSSAGVRRDPTGNVALASTGVASPTPASRPGGTSIAGELARGKTQMGRAAYLVGAVLVGVMLSAGGYLVVGKDTVVPPAPIAPTRALAPPPAAAPVVAPVVIAPAAVAPEAAAAQPPAEKSEASHRRAPKPHKTPVHAAVAGSASQAAGAAKVLRTFATAFSEGDALFRVGEYASALAKYEEAARLNPGDAKSERQIGKCYMRLADAEHGAQHLRRYLELAPDAADAVYIRAQLKK